jgi:ATP-dependent DNA helicase 2 subunit 1
MNDAFDPKAFYWDILQVSEDEDVGTIKETFSSNFQDLEANLRKKEYKKRALASIPFQIAPDVHIGVKMYCLFRESRPAYPIALDPSTNDQLQCVTKWVCDATGAVLEDHQFKTYYPYADEKVFFTKDEMNTIKDLGPPGLTLMGFKSRRKLKSYHNIKNPYFLYPDESQIQGSTRAFAALLTQMVKMDKIAIARMIYRRRTVPRFVALLPQDEVIAPDGTQQEFPGFHLIHLPYADDIRNLKLEPTPIAYPDLIVKAKTMISDLRLKFHPETIFNPKLQRHYAVLQALALDQEAPEETPDMTLPDLDNMEKFADHIKAFAAASKTVIGDGDDDEKGSGRKRKTPAKSNSRTAKPAAGSSKRVTTGTKIDVRGMHEAGTLKKLTIPQLKIYCKEHRLGQGGNKEEILRRVADHLDGKAPASKKKK